MKKSKTFFIFLILTLLYIFPGCSKPSMLTSSNIYFDTVVTITLYNGNNNLMEACFSLCEKYELLFNKNSSDSDIYKINHSHGTPVTVSDETIELLDLALNVCEESGGLFDITTAGLSDLWNITESTSVPDAHAISKCLSHISYKNILINGNTVTLTDPETTIDLGGIAKGYIGDKIADFLRKKENVSAYINLGGNVTTLGKKPDGTPFCIGIQKPFDTNGNVISTVSLSDTSIATSGSYQRYFEQNGTIYHHIMNPFTGYPATSNLLSVSVLCENAALGDAYSTTAFLMGLDDGKKFLESLPGVEGLFITTDFEIVKTSGFSS